jgi:RNase P subunit RPR2
MSYEILNNLALNQCCSQCGSFEIAVGVNVEQDEGQNVLLQCQDCLWEYRTTLKKVRDAGFLPNCFDTKPETHTVIIQVDGQTAFIEFQIKSA